MPPFAPSARIFTVHLHPEKRPLAEFAEFVPERFSWAAFFFGWLWAVYHRMGWVAAGMLGANLVIGLLVARGWVHGGAGTVLQLALSAWFGFEANDFRRANLKKRGYTLSDVVAEDSLLHAQQRYLTRHASALA